MSSAVDVGVVIPAHNAETYLAATLDSLLAQAGVSWRCVVVDDGSRDRTLAVAERYASADDRIRAVRQENSGPCVARNLGYELLGAAPRHVTFMDADDVWMPGALAKLIAAVVGDPAAVGAHGLGEIIDASGTPVLPGAFSALGRGRVGCDGGWPRRWPLDRPTTFATVVTSSVVFPPGLILTRRSALERAGLFDPDVRYAEDWDLLIRLSRLGHYRFVNEPLLWYRRHASNMGQSAEVARQCARVQYKAFHSPHNTPAQRRIVRQSWRASQVLTMRDRAASARAQFRDGRYLDALLTTGRLPFIAYRYLRGYPTPPR